MQHRFPLTLSPIPRGGRQTRAMRTSTALHMVDGVVVASLRGCSKVLGIDVGPGASRRRRLADGPHQPERRGMGGAGHRPAATGLHQRSRRGVLRAAHRAHSCPTATSCCSTTAWCARSIRGRSRSWAARGATSAARWSTRWTSTTTRRSSCATTPCGARGDHIGYANGNVDVLDNGDWLVSWGRVLTCP